MHGCRGHAWLLGGGMHGCRGCVWLGGMCGCRGCMVVGGACVVARWHTWLQAGMHGCQGRHGWLLGGHAWLWGVCVVAGGHAWLAGACVVAGGHVWLLGACVVDEDGGMVAGGACIVAGGVCVGYDEIRSMRRWYASYWNAFLFGYSFKSRDKINQ